MEEGNPIYGPFFGVMGATAAMVFSALGAAYGTAKSGTGIAAMSVMRPELIMKSIIPVVRIPPSSAHLSSPPFPPLCTRSWRVSLRSMGWSWPC